MTASRPETFSQADPAINGKFLLEYRKNKRPVTRISTAFTQPVIATDPIPTTNSLRIPASFQSPTHTGDKFWGHNT